MNKPQVCYVAFLDILGFANFVENNTSEFVLKYLSNFTTTNGVFASITPNISTSVLSDTIALYTAVEDDAKKDLTNYINLLRCIGMLQYQSITAPNLHGLPLRGAVTKGEFYSNNKDILFGKAWVDAFHLERNKAIVPRVLVKKESNDFNYMLIQSTDSISNIREAPLRQDIDGELHCNYLNNILDDNGKPLKDSSFVLSHKNSVIRNLYATRTNIKIYQKYIWIKDYHNWFCAGYKELQNHHISDKDILKPQFN